MKDSVYDSAVLAETCRKDGFELSENQFFLTDAGYFVKSYLMLVLYSEMTYHLKKYAKANKQLIILKKLFNLCHISLRSCIKKVFEIFKQ